MGYVLPILTDAGGGFSSWVFAQLSDGSRVLLVFDESSPRLDDLARLLQRAKKPSVGRLGAMVLAASSLADLTDKLEEADPSLFEQAVLVNEGDPSFGRILDDLFAQPATDLVVG